MPTSAIAPSHPAVGFRPPIAVRSAGAIAHRALLACAGITRPVPGFEATPFRLAGNTLVWIGVDVPIHPRVARVDSALSDFDRVCLKVKIAQVHTDETVGGQWFPAIDSLQTLTRAILRVVRYQKPAGFGRLLTAQTLPFPLSHRRDPAVALAQACADGNALAFKAAAVRLLGVGSGLTPSGDDFVGGALFARHAMTASGSDAQALAWNGARDSILAVAEARTHVISFTLLQDLAHGASYTALHQLASALRGADEPSMFDAMRGLVAIGHSSGWDMLTGFIAAVSGNTHLAGTTRLTGTTPHL